MSDIPSSVSDDDRQVVYAWVDQVSFTRSKKNISRDFCDGVLVAELIRFFHPKLVDVHNYPQAHSLKQKFTNWSTLQKKILERIGMRVTREEIEGLVNAKHGLIERFLFALKRKLDNYQYEPLIALSNIPSVKSKVVGYSDISRQLIDQSHQQHYGSNENSYTSNVPHKLPPVYMNVKQPPGYEQPDHLTHYYPYPSQAPPGNPHFLQDPIYLLSQKDEEIRGLRETLEVL